MERTTCDGQPKKSNRECQTGSCMLKPCSRKSFFQSSGRESMLWTSLFPFIATRSPTDLRWATQVKQPGMSDRYFLPKKVFFQACGCFRGLILGGQSKAVYLCCVQSMSSTYPASVNTVLLLLFCSLSLFFLVLSRRQGSGRQEGCKPGKSVGGTLQELRSSCCDM